LSAAVHVVPHTHWDREWYLPFQRFRLQLVGLVDRLLDLMEADERYRFTLDGQLATLDDYFEVRPESEPRIRRLVEEGRLAIGPWQVLMDEFFVSGETIVRNLEQGLQRGEELGGVMRVGYLPDMFGHIAQMPQILRLAGIDQAVVWRGVPAAIDSHAFEWEAPDGSSVRTEYLPHGYGNGATLLDVPGQLADKLSAVHESLHEFFGDDPVLAMYGTDHTEPLPELAALIEESGAAVELSTLPDYLETADGRDRLRRWRGELRSSARANMLMGTTSARIDLKAAMARAERALTRYAEPFQALYGTVWPERLLELAWRRVLESSAHDSICGCSADEVSAQVLVRCAEAEQIASGLAQDAAAQVARGVARGSIVVLNPSPERRTGLVELNVRVPHEWEELAFELPDGTFAAAQEVARNDPLLHTVEVRGSDVSEWLRRRLHGRELFARHLNGFELGERSLTLEVDDEDDPVWLEIDEVKHEIDAATKADADAAWKVRILARPRRRVVTNVPVPPLGWTAVRPVEGRGDVEHPVQAGALTLDNGLLAVTVADDGSFALNGLEGIGRLVDGQDTGDSYNYAPPEVDRIVETPERVSVDCTAGGPVRGELAIVRQYDWGVPVEVTTQVELRAGEPFCRVRVSFDNPLGDHRLRFHVPLAESAGSSAAEGQFAVVERGLEAEGGFGEHPLPTFPAHGFVDAGGMAVLLDHVIEYELVDGRELALTLLRSIGMISRSAHPYRESPAGPELEIPDAQCRRAWHIAFALFPHEGGWQEGGVLAQLERYRHPFLAVGAIGTHAAREHAGPELSGDGVVLSSLRRREGALVARVACEHPAAARATFGEAELNLRAWEVRSVELP
jgi:glycosyl hydrolase family 38/alpha mannosidase-like protein